MRQHILVSVQCYGASAGEKPWEDSPEGDAPLAAALLPCHERLQASIVILSPVDAPVRWMGSHICRHAGKRAYIGQDSLDRQIECLKILLEYPFEYYLMNDADSCCLAAELPKVLYEGAAETLWSNLLVEPRLHKSPYLKLAAQLPYFLTRESLKRLLEVAPRVRAHPITPFIDWFMVALACEAGLKLRSFAELENPPLDLADANTSYATRYGRIRNGAIMIHPIKTVKARDDCIEARKLYEAVHPEALK